MAQRELLFSLTAKDFQWEYFKTGGPGGQNKNKRDTACRCTHPPSGAVGIGADERYQRRNRETAFKRCVESQKFQTWHKIQTAKFLTESETEAELRQRVEEQMMAPQNLKVEVKEGQKWVEVSQ